MICCNVFAVCAQKGDETAVTELLNEGATVGLVDKRGQNALDHATEAGHTNCVKILEAVRQS